MITAPAVTNQVYQTLTGKQSYTVPEFSNSDPYCAIVYTLVYDTSKSWLTLKDARTLEWDSTSNAEVGVYTITVQATGPEGATSEASYTLTVERNC